MKTLRIKMCLYICLGALLPYSHTYAETQTNEFYSHEELKTKVAKFLENYVAKSHPDRFHVEAGNIDYRLRLKRCDKNLSLFVTQQARLSRSVTVGIRCEGNKPWRIYVPSQVFIYKRVLATTRVIQRGTSLNSADVELVEREVTGLHFGYFVKPNQVAGKTARRMILPGAVLRPQLLAEATVIKRGELVTIVAEVGGIQVKMNGRALGSGAQGRSIKVQNLSSRRIIEGIVVGKGIVKVNL